MLLLLCSVVLSAHAVRFSALRPILELTLDVPLPQAKLDFVPRLYSAL